SVAMERTTPIKTDARIVRVIAVGLYHPNSDLLPSPAASRHPLPEGEGPDRPYSRSKIHRMNCTAYRICLWFVSVMLLAVTAGCVTEKEAKEKDQVIQSIRSVMDAQQAAWNRGDIDSFMEGYERSATTTFVSGDELMRGWQTVLDRYKQRYNSPAQMGTLSFSELEIQP